MSFAAGAAPSRSTSAGRAEDAIEFFFARCYPGPHSTKQILVAALGPAGAAVAAPVDRGDADETLAAGRREATGGWRALLESAFAGWPRERGIDLPSPRARWRR